MPAHAAATTNQPTTHDATRVTWFGPVRQTVSDTDVRWDYVVRTRGKLRVLASAVGFEPFKAMREVEELTSILVAASSNKRRSRGV